MRFLHMNIYHILIGYTKAKNGFSAEFGKKNKICVQILDRGAEIVFSIIMTYVEEELMIYTLIVRQHLAELT